MPNSAKKNFPEDAASDPQTGMEAGADTGIDDFDFGSMDDLATMMVEALTIPLPTDFRDAEPAGGDRSGIVKTDTLTMGALQPPSSKRVN